MKYKILSTIFLPGLAVLVIAIGVTVNRSSAQDSAGPAPKDADRANRLAEMKQIAGSFQAVVLDKGTETLVPPLREPLHRWSDPTRESNDGALWAWGAAGRPIAIMAIELYPQDKTFGTVWALEFVSLSTGPIKVEGGEHFNRYYPDIAPPIPGGRVRWSPAKGGLAFSEISDAAAPASTEAERLRQMTSLLKRFSAREFYNIKSQEYALRPLPHPIHRYNEAASGLLDGAIFIYANETNPEVLLVIEARRGAGSPTWSYAAAPLTRAEPTLRLDQKDVWTHPFTMVPSPDDAYFLARKPRNASASDSTTNKPESAPPSKKTGGRPGSSEPGASAP